MTPIPLSLYVHWPWCVRKCPYCDFNSHALRGELPEAAYLAALLIDLEHEARRAQGRELVSIFFGGGTPSLFSAGAMGKLLEAVARQLPLAADLEVTMEVNPGTVEYASLAPYRVAGINRLSVGVQSFDDGQLERIGRIHNAAEAVAAVEAARTAGFDNLNLDLMYGLPGQDTDQALADLEQALALAPEHLSHYQLTIEPNTWFHKHRPVLPDPDHCWEMQLACQQRMAAADFGQYEISAYARPGHQCRHNLNYWQFGDYLAIGAGAHGKLTRPDGLAVTRHFKPRHPRAYMQACEQGNTSVQQRPVMGVELLFEFALNAWRLKNGVPLGLLNQRTGLILESEQEPWRTALARGWLVLDNDRIGPTSEGQRWLDDLTALFLP